MKLKINKTYIKRPWKKLKIKRISIKVEISTTKMIKAAGAVAKLVAKKEKLATLKLPFREVPDRIDRVM